MDSELEDLCQDPYVLTGCLLAKHIWLGAQNLIFDSVART